MSKKDKLKKQSQKQLEARKQAQRDEASERASAGESKAAKKLRRQAKRLNSTVTTVLKVLMCIPFLWSGLYYGGIFIVGISMGQMTDVPGRIAAFLAIGSALCLAGIVFAFLSKYIVQFILVAAGTAFFMSGASYIVNKAQERITDGRGLTEEQQGLASRWRWGLYPILVLTAISAVLLGINIVRRILKKRRKQRELDNAPVKSIVEE
ncbi:MAG: hypothetical protein IJ561_01655 [Ruminococcus sp.]|nr:hypothetical protein [Ruminococcus sp.]